MKVRQPDTFGKHRIHMRSLNHRVAMRANISIPLIIGDDENDICPNLVEGKQRGLSSLGGATRED